MLITGPDYGVVAFAMAVGGGWRLEPPPDGVEPVATLEAGPWRLWHSRNGVKDAVHHDGRFYSITYSGEVEAWEEHDTNAAGVFTTAVVAPRLLPPDAEHRKRDLQIGSMRLKASKIILVDMVDKRGFASININHKLQPKLQPSTNQQLKDLFLPTGQTQEIKSTGIEGFIQVRSNTTLDS
ncbi:hypothetical protein D1007_49071 [Hordeum vulgare]|nr:hypothetical protein D1007_49071 [Hordeum vulgare]